MIFTCLLISKIIRISSNPKLLTEKTILKILLINIFIELKSCNLPDFGKNKVNLNKINNLNSLYKPTKIFNNVHDVTHNELIIIFI